MKDTQPWGIYDLKLQGSDTYYNPNGSTLWYAWIEGSGEFGDAEADWLGLTGGIWLDGEIRGALRGMYLTEDDVVGLIKGSTYGLYNEEEAGYGTWIGESIGMYMDMGITEFPELVEIDIYGLGLGSFEGGGVLEDVLIEGIALNIADQWGIWGVGVEGSYTGPTSPFLLAVGGSADTDAYWFGTISGQWEEGILEGLFRGFLMYDSDGEAVDTIATSQMTGESIGTFEIEGEDFQAVATGDWIELTELEADILGFDLEDLSDFVDIPITEIYSDILSGTGSFAAGGTLAGTMDVSFYANEYANIWAGLIEGTYEGLADNDWSLDLTNTDFSATLDGTQWSDNEWLADVSGTGPDDLTFTGQAGGTYQDGAFSGVGAGTFETGE